MREKKDIHERPNGRSVGGGHSGTTKKRRLIRTLAAVLTAALVSSTGAFLPQAKAIDTAEIPILMYHDIVPNDVQTSDMRVTIEQFREDMEFLQQYGYTALLPSDLVNIRAGTKEMPHKPVMITFDDGYESNYTYAYPILRQTGMKATISVIANSIRQTPTSGSYYMLTWAQCREMYESGYIDIGCHTYALHNNDNRGQYKPGVSNGVQRLPGEGYSAYRTRAGSDLEIAVTMIEQNVGNDCIYFAYPFGATDAWFGSCLIDQKILVSTTTQGDLADISKNLYGLPRYRITSDRPVSTLFQHSATLSPVSKTLVVDGKRYGLPAYCVGGKNYISASDLATLFNNTTLQFSVQQTEKGAVLQAGQRYVSQGNELSAENFETGKGSSITSTVQINGQQTLLEGYTVGDENYYSIRSLCNALGYSVIWSDRSMTITVIHT